MPDKPFEEAANPVTEDVATRSSINAASLRESAGIANVNNPYSSANMQKAAIQLSKLYSTPPRPVYPTHEYVRFLPQDSTQVDILEEELKLELASYPLDRELSDQEVEFYSNDLINGYTWLYGVVPKNFRYPSGIRYEVLQDACLESDDPLLRSEISPAVVGGGTTGGTVGTGATWYDEVLAQSMKNAGIPIIGNGPSSTGGWTPQAIVTCYDDATNQRIPLQGVKVRVSALLNVGSGFLFAAFWGFSLSCLLPKREKRGSDFTLQSGFAGFAGGFVGSTEPHKFGFQFCGGEAYVYFPVVGH